MYDAKCLCLFLRNYDCLEGYLNSLCRIKFALESTRMEYISQLRFLKAYYVVLEKRTFSTEVDILYFARVHFLIYLFKEIDNIFEMFYSINQMTLHKVSIR